MDPVTLTPMPPLTDVASPLAVLRDLQHGDGDSGGELVVDPPVKLDLLTAQEIHDMLPEELARSVGLKWIRTNVPGKKRIGRIDMWPRKAVVAYFESDE